MPLTLVNTSELSVGEIKHLSVITKLVNGRTSWNLNLQIVKFPKIFIYSQNNILS